MIYVDDRIGSADLIGHLRHWHVPCQLARLDFGDAAFGGNGPDGPVSIGIEIKKVHDALNCMADGRFAGHQLPGLVQDYDRVWMVVEGWYSADFSTGVLLAPGQRRRDLAIGARRFMYRDLDNWCTSLEMCAGVRVRRVGDRVETARVIADIFGWFQKDWDEHHSHLAIHDAGPDRALLVKPTLCRKIAAQLPGVGWKRSIDVAGKFVTTHDMVTARVDEWESIPGIGPGIARKVYDALRGR